jgi:hypothetical protein
MSTAKAGLNWSMTVERYAPRSLPLCRMLATVMSTAREKTTEGIPIWSLVIIWIISLTIFRKEKKHGVEQVSSTDGRRNGAFAQ